MDAGHCSRFKSFAVRHDAVPFAFAILAAAVTIALEAVTILLDAAAVAASAARECIAVQMLCRGMAKRLPCHGLHVHQDRGR